MTDKMSAEARQPQVCEWCHRRTTVRLADDGVTTDAYPFVVWRQPPVTAFGFCQALCLAAWAMTHVDVREVRL